MCDALLNFARKFSTLFAMNVREWQRIAKTSVILSLTTEHKSREYRFFTCRYKFFNLLLCLHPMIYQAEIKLQWCNNGSEVIFTFTARASF